MPELAEIESVRLRIVEELKGKKIKEVVLDKSDKYLFAFAKPSEVVKALTGAKILGAKRKGKYFWIELDRKPWPIFHLGMSGNMTFLNPKSKSHEHTWGGSKLWKKEDEDLRSKLWFSRLLLVFQGGAEMSLSDPRRFGRMWLTEDPLNHPRIKKLGYDALLDFPTAKILGEKLSKRKKAVKSVLLDQSLFAGIGNWLADEILFQARISPHTLSSKLTAAQVKKLHAQTIAVVKKAAALRADYERFPKTWIFNDRWGKSKTAKTSRGKIIHEDIGGRTTAWVPGWQS